MGKLMPLLLVIVAIELCMMLFLGVTTPTMQLLQLILNPTLWSTLSFIDFLSTTIGTVSLTLIFVGTFVSQKSDTLIFAGIAAGFFSYGQTFIEAYQRFASNTVAFGDFNNLVAILILGPMIVTYIYVLLKFWRCAD